MTWTSPVREKVLARVPGARADWEIWLVGDILVVGWNEEVKAILDYPTLTPLGEEEVARLEALPLPPPPEWDQEPDESGERPLQGRVEYALARYRGFWRNEAPRNFRETYPEEPTLEGVLALGQLRGYWTAGEETEAKAMIADLLEKK